MQYIYEISSLDTNGRWVNRKTTDKALAEMFVKLAENLGHTHIVMCEFNNQASF